MEINKARGALQLMTYAASRVGSGISLAEVTDDAVVLCVDERNNINTVTPHGTPLHAFMNQCLLTNYPELTLEYLHTDNIETMHGGDGVTLHKHYYRLVEEVEPEGMKLFRQRYRDRR